MKAGAGDGNRNHSGRDFMRIYAGFCTRQTHKSAFSPPPTATNCYNFSFYAKLALMASATKS
jgi:hypothetical protein